MNDRILIIRTGGTFESDVYLPPYTLENPPLPVTTLKGEHSLFPAMVKELGYVGDVDFYHWTPAEEERFVVDSIEYTPQKLSELAHIIRHDDDHQFFLLPHGSTEGVIDAMTLADELARSGKTVVLEAAMVPLSMGHIRRSDGVDITEFALKHIRKQPPGVWIAGYGPDGQLGFFKPEDVVKDEEKSKASLKFTLKPSMGR